MLILTSTFLVYVIFNDRDEIPVFEYASLVNSSFAAPFTHPHMDDMKNKMQQLSAPDDAGGTAATDDSTPPEVELVANQSVKSLQSQSSYTGFYVPQKSARRFMFFHRGNTLEAQIGQKRFGTLHEGITITTQLSVDRIDKRLYDIVREWNGPMSVAIYLRRESDTARIRQILRENEMFANLADVHLYIEGDDPLSKERTARRLPPPYPINVLRNMALHGVKQRAAQNSDGQLFQSPWVLVIDADARISGTMQMAIEQLHAALAFGEGPPRYHAFDDERMIFVIPAFSRRDPNNLEPLLVKNKRDLRRYLINNEAEVMHASSFPISYLGSLDVWRWTFATEPYVVRYTHRWEPYYIARLSPNFAFFDERFVDRGLNKAQQQFDLFARDYRYVVVPDFFAVDTPMPVGIGWGLAAEKAIKLSYLNFNATYLNRVWHSFVSETLHKQNLKCDSKVYRRNRLIYKPRCVSSLSDSKLSKSAHKKKGRWRDIKSGNNTDQTNEFRKCSPRHPHAISLVTVPVGARHRDPGASLPEGARGVRPADILRLAERKNFFKFESHDDMSEEATLERQIYGLNSTPTSGSYMPFGSMSKADFNDMHLVLVDFFESQPKSVTKWSPSSSYKKITKGTPSKEVVGEAWHLYKLYTGERPFVLEYPFPIAKDEKRQSLMTFITILDPLRTFYAQQYQQMLITLRLREAAARRWGESMLPGDECSRLVSSYIKDNSPLSSHLEDDDTLRVFVDVCIPRNMLATFFCGRGKDCDILSLPVNESNGNDIIKRRVRALRGAKDAIRNEFLVVGTLDSFDEGATSNSEGKLHGVVRLLGKILPSFFNEVIESEEFVNLLSTRQRNMAFHDLIPPSIITFMERRSDVDGNVFRFAENCFADQLHTCVRR